MFSQKFPPREKGQGLVEYALILVLVSVAVIAIMIFLGGSVGQVFEEVSTNLSGQTITGTGTEYVIGGFSANATGGPVCTIEVSSFTVTMYEDGERAANEAVSVSIQATGGGAVPGNGTTNANGVATISATSVSGNCSGTVTVTGGGNSRSTGY